MLEKYFENIENKEEWLPIFEKYLPCYQINTDLRICHFLAQCFHESLNLTKLEENLKYSAEALLKLFSNRITPEQAKRIERNEKEIAKAIYGKRKDLGNETEEDGYTYRGRGIIQLTGKANYTAYQVFVPDMLAKCKDTSVKVACEVWAKNKLNELADKNNITAIRKKINGGLNGLEDFERKFNILYSL